MFIDLLDIDINRRDPIPRVLREEPVTYPQGYECVAENALLDVDEAIKSELDELVGKGSSDKDYAWWRYSPRHRNWDSEEALLALTEPDVTDYWKHHLIQIAAIVTSTVAG